MTQRRALIGLTADLEHHPAGQTEAEYVLRCTYAEAIIQVGGLPVILPYDAALAPDCVATLDGVVVTGGMFDIDPGLYGGSPRPGIVTKDNRTQFESALLDAALAVDLPVLGICNGMQLLAVRLGGKLVQDIQRYIPGGIKHLPERPPTRAVYSVAFADGSLLRRITGSTRCDVNSPADMAILRAFVEAANLS